LWSALEREGKPEQLLSDVTQRIMPAKLDFDDIEDRFLRTRKIEEIAIWNVLCFAG